MFKDFYGTKENQTQTFTDKGLRVVVTKIRLHPTKLLQKKDKAKDGYQALKVGIQVRTHPLFIRELSLTDDDSHFVESLKLGDEINFYKILKEGDKVKVTAKTKGRGFAGVVKRWHFSGGPRTHGQSDRERAPGSIGQGTDPGRIWKGKKMPGHMGNKTKTIKGLQIFKIDEEKNLIWLKGLVPGGKGSLLKITKYDLKT